MDNIDWKVYRELNKDLIKNNYNTKGQLLNHWNKYGHAENRMSKVTDLTPDFNWKIYSI